MRVRLGQFSFHSGNSCRGSVWMVGFGTLDYVKKNQYFFKKTDKVWTNFIAFWTNCHWTNNCRIGHYVVGSFVVGYFAFGCFAFGCLVVGHSVVGLLVVGLNVIGPIVVLDIVSFSHLSGANLLSLDHLSLDILSQHRKHVGIFWNSISKRVKVQKSHTSHIILAIRALLTPLGIEF